MFSFNTRNGRQRIVLVKDAKKSFIKMYLYSLNTDIVNIWRIQLLIKQLTNIRYIKKMGSEI